MSLFTNIEMKLLINIGFSIIYESKTISELNCHILFYAFIFLCPNSIRLIKFPGYYDITGSVQNKSNVVSLQPFFSHPWRYCSYSVIYKLRAPLHPPTVIKTRSSKNNALNMPVSYTTHGQIHDKYCIILLYNCMPTTL